MHNGRAEDITYSGRRLPALPALGTMCIPLACRFHARSNIGIRDFGSESVPRRPDYGADHYETGIYDATWSQAL